MRVLVVEDEEALASSIARGLRREGFAVDVVLDGAAALQKADATRYDVLVLDRNLPGRSGDAVCREVAAAGESRILMLTAAATVEERVHGLAIGADDYLPKPFVFVELVARVRALARRTLPALPAVLACGDLTLDSARHRATRGGAHLELNTKEFAVLETLMAARGAVVSVEDLLERVWDEHTDPCTNTVRVTVMNLRRKLGDPPVIETIIGAGYQLPCPP